MRHMADPATASEARHSIRRNYRASRRKSVVDLSLVTVEMKPAGFGLMLDVSEGGLGVQVMNQVEPGTNVQIAFKVPELAARIEGSGIVSWYDGDGRVGIRFQQIEENCAKELKRWIDSL